MYTYSSLIYFNLSCWVRTFDKDSLFLEGDPDIPKAATGIILFAHGSGSSRHSPRNKYVADCLR